MELINVLPDFTDAFGDKRIDKRAKEALQKLMKGRNSSIRNISDNEAEQRSLYRLLGNESFTEHAIEKSLVCRCNNLCEGRHVLAIQDTVELNLSGQKRRHKPNSGFGEISKTGVEGFLLHSSMVIDAKKATALGYSYIKTWHRPADRQTKTERNYSRQPIEDKESYKWIEATCQTKKALSQAEKITVVADRESDIFELIVKAKELDINLLIRSRLDRKLTTSERMLTHLQNLPVMHTYQLSILGDIRKNIPKRIAHMELKWSEITILKPGKNTAGQPGQTLTVVEAKEAMSKGINWRLLTTHKIHTYEDALQIVEWYKQRWYIEQMHRLLKQEGFRIERSQLAEGHAVRKLTMLAMIAALKIIQMMMAYEDDNEQDAASVFTEDEQLCMQKAILKLEGNTPKQQNPHKQGTLKWATWVIARLGGWKGYKSQRKPGPIVLQKGFIKFYNIYEGWLLSKT